MVEMVRNCTNMTAAIFLLHLNWAPVADQHPANIQATKFVTGSEFSFSQNQAPLEKITYRIIRCTCNFVYFIYPKRYSMKVNKNNQPDNLKSKFQVKSQKNIRFGGWG